MAKITAVIDIGSNSVRMLVFQKTSRFGFFLLDEIKSRVRISEASYQNGGYLQEAAMERAVAAISSFAAIARARNARKIICVATSAVRDAPNKNELLKRVQNACKINIRIIDGEKESYYGGIAAANLLPIKEGVTIDIGGGSTELALIAGGRVRQTLSFQLGTVRLKELFFDGTPRIDDARAYVRKELQSLPPEFRQSLVIGIGGTLRALAQALIKRESYALNVLHGYEYPMEKNRDFFDAVITAQKEDKLKKLGFKQDRFDVIREGLLIFTEIVAVLGGEKVVTSGVGVREGVYLCDILRTSQCYFPQGYNPSVRSLMDRFDIDAKAAAYARKTALQLFDAMAPLHGLDASFKPYLSTAAKLADIGVYVNFYKKSLHAFNIIFEGLDYGFTHSERVLISKLVKNQQKKVLAKYEHNNRLSRFLPEGDAVRWLSFILFVAGTINQDRHFAKVSVTLEGKDVRFAIDAPAYLAREALDGVKTPGKGKLLF